MHSIDKQLPIVTREDLVGRLKALQSGSSLTQLAIQHVEENMERGAGIARAMTVDDFEQATTTVSCLRQFLVDCISAFEGRVHGEPLFMTPADGSPRRQGGWAWHGLSVPFTLGSERGRVGIYKYQDAPPGWRRAQTARKDSLAEA
ncbi:MAG TPA: hypothetical protein VK509_22280 [Polyangiales bacterium]|nr:hypothetical protein [Polyangiales bacterium]